MGKDAPSLQETAAFLEAAEAMGPRDHALACLLALNGLPLTSVCGTRASDLRDDGEQRTVLVSLTGEHGERRMPVPLAPRTAAAIDEHLDGRDEGPLLLDDHGRPLSGPAAAVIVRRIVHAAGLEYRLN